MSWYWWVAGGLLLLVVALAALGIWAKNKSQAQSGNTPAGTTGGNKTKWQFKPYWNLAKNVTIVVFICWGFWFLVIDVMQRADSYIHETPIPVGNPSVLSSIGERSLYFRSQMDFLNENIKFCYFDAELKLTREEAWDCADMIRLESNNKMYNPDGSVVRGEENHDDIGTMMINIKWSAEEIAKAGCNVESYECQKKVFRLIFLQKRSFERWKAYDIVKQLPIRAFRVAAPANEEGGEEFHPPLHKSCHVKPDRSMQMQSGNGGWVDITPDYVPFAESSIIRFRSKDGVPSGVTILCR